MIDPDTHRQILQELRSVFEQYLHVYFQKRDLDGIKQMLHPDMTGIGTAEDENAFDFQTVMQLFERDITQAPCPFAVNIHTLHTDVLNASTGMINAVLSLSSNANNTLVALLNVRLSILFVRDDAKWQIRHIHFSEPAAHTPMGKSYPERHLAEYNEILEQIVLDRTLQIQEKNEALERSLAEKKNIEQSLWEAEETFSSIVKSSPMGIYLYQVTEDGRLIFLGANPAAERMVQVDHSTLIGKSIEEAFPSLADTEIPMRFTRAALHAEGWCSEQIIYQSPGAAGIYEVYAFGIGQKKAAVMFNEISERKKAEEEKLKLREQLNQKQKMESIGRLAGGVAHDFNNMLGVIMGHAEIAIESIPESSTIYEDLVNIRQAAAHSADLTHQLLAFARRQTALPLVQDINQTVSGMRKMLSRLIGESIELIWKPAPFPIYINMDTGQVDQILANLCVNARDAITSSAGRITIKTDSIDLNKTLHGSHCEVPAGSYALLIVEDNGCGMPADISENIFEPFFTTKGAGEGTGLGLATVFGIVSQNDGYISVDSEPGSGTAFTIFLPRLQQGMPSQKPEVSLSVTKGNETILVAEDNEAILKMTTIMLSRHGYNVIPTASPEEALQMAQKEKDNIHLLLTDVVMPCMNGRELAEKILEINPDVKILFMSGYPEDIVAKHGAIENGLAFISKPFTADNIIGKIRNILDATLL